MLNDTALLFIGDSTSRRAAAHLSNWLTDRPFQDTFARKLQPLAPHHIVDWVEAADVSYVANDPLLSSFGGDAVVSINVSHHWAPTSGELVHELARVLPMLTVASAHKRKVVVVNVFTHDVLPYWHWCVFRTADSEPTTIVWRCSPVKSRRSTPFKLTKDPVILFPTVDVATPGQWSPSSCRSSEPTL
jgi:hypothetical protein